MNGSRTLTVQSCVFASFGEFLEDIRDWRLPVKMGPFEKINQGCYSNDSRFKQLNRLAEGRLMAADTFLSMAAALKQECGRRKPGK